MTTPVPEPYREFAEALIASARNTLESQGLLAPIAVIGDTERRFLCPIGGLGNMPPNMAIQVIRSLTAKEHADFVMVATECWAATALTEDEAKARLAQYKRVTDMPDRVSAVYVSLETYQGTWSAIVPREGDEGRYTFGEVELRLSLENTSPFRDLLPRRDMDTLQ